MTRSFSMAGILVSVLVLGSCVSRTQLSRNNTVAPTPKVATEPAGVEKQEARKLPGKFVDREEARATPSLKSHEGPIQAEKEKAAERAYPGVALPLEGAATGRREIARIGSFNDSDSDRGQNWVLVGPETATYPAATSRTNAPFVVSGRISALAIDPRCDVDRADEPLDREDRHCRLLVGAAGGGIWRTDRPFSNTPQWTFTSGDFGTNAIGLIVADPRNPDVIYAGTGEPNASADSAAGMGLYRSQDGGENWTRISSSVTFTGANGWVTLADGFNNLSISSIAFDPRYEGSFYVATTLGVRGVSTRRARVLRRTLRLPGSTKRRTVAARVTQVWNGGGVSCAPAGTACLTSLGRGQGRS